MADFLLIHGAWHGAWCWDRVTPLLEGHGLRAWAIDLPGGGADTTPAAEATLDACARRVVASLEQADKKVWLVGHSLGGATIAQAAEMIPEKLEGVIFVAASCPLDGQSHLDALGADDDSLASRYMTIDPDRGCATLPEEHRAACFYSACPPATTADALSRLREWQSLLPALTPVSLTPARFGQLPHYYVECLQDRTIPISTQRRMQAAQGIANIATLDTDHSPFLSCPDQLATILAGWAS